MDLKELLAAVHILMNRSADAYREYTGKGKTFRYACRLRELNSEMIDLLSNNQDIMTDQLCKAAHELLGHYNTWRNKWDKHKEEFSPGQDDLFAFQNEHTFPKQAAALFEKEYEKLFTA